MLSTPPPPPPHRPKPVAAFKQSWLSELGLGSFGDSRTNATTTGSVQTGISYSLRDSIGDGTSTSVVGRSSGQEFLKTSGHGTTISVSAEGYSKAFLAARRRERVRKIVMSIRALDKFVHEDQFYIFTQRPLSEIKFLIQFLEDAESRSEVETEGNSCEILRQVRDSLLRRGWERYREDSVRIEVCKILGMLTDSEEVTAAMADQSMDAFLDLGLEPVVGDNIFHVIEKDGEADQSDR